VLFASLKEGFEKEVFKACIERKVVRNWNEVGIKRVSVISEIYIALKI
jgi:hypothetical protein